MFREQSFAGWLLTLLQLADCHRKLLAAVRVIQKKEIKSGGRPLNLLSVLEGAFVSLCEVDTPLPVCMHLQYKGAQLESTQWTAKQTKLGF